MPIHSCFDPQSPVLKRIDLECDREKVNAEPRRVEQAARKGQLALQGTFAFCKAKGVVMARKTRIRQKRQNCCLALSPYICWKYIKNQLFARSVAERVGFEPTLEFPLNTLSKRAPSAARPPLQGRLLTNFEFTTSSGRPRFEHERRAVQFSASNRLKSFTGVAYGLIFRNAAAVPILSLRNFFDRGFSAAVNGNNEKGVSLAFDISASTTTCRCPTNTTRGSQDANVWVGDFKRNWNAWCLFH